MNDFITKKHYAKDKANSKDREVNKTSLLSQKMKNFDVNDSFHKSGYKLLRGVRNHLRSSKPSKFLDSIVAKIDLAIPVIL